jgi:hypothetical protein
MSSLMAGGRLRIHSSCKNLIDQLQSCSWDPAVAERGEDKPVKKEDHALDGCRYALVTTRQIWRNEILPAGTPRN